MNQENFTPEVVNAIRKNVEIGRKEMAEGRFVIVGSIEELEMELDRRRLLAKEDK